MRHALLLLLCVSALSCTPAPAPKPWKPAPLPIGPKPSVESADPVEAARVIGAEPTTIIPNGTIQPRNANYGWKPDEKASKEFLDTLPAKTLFDANPELREPPKVKSVSSYQDPAKEPTLLYRALYKVSPGWTVGSQGIGDCVSWGWAHGVDISLAVDKVVGRTSEWKPAATEAIYGGSRVEARGRKTGGYSDGSYGAAAAKWCKDWGVVWRQQYTEPPVDLTTYSSSRAKQWGNFGNGGEGDDGKLDEQAKKFPATQVAQVRSFAEAAAAIESGYPVPVCSGQGFSSRRDEQGFSAARGSWAHCLLPGTLVFGRDVKPIEQIKPGDIVTTHLGREGLVSAITHREYSGDAIILRMVGLPDIRATDEHPMLVMRKELGSPAWIDIRDVRTGDYLMVPPSVFLPPMEIPKWPDCPRAAKALKSFSPSVDLEFLIGYYVANGSVRKNHGVSLCLPFDCADVTRLENAFRSLGVEPRTTEHRTYRRITVDSVVMAHAFLEWFGDCSERKKFPAFVWSEGWNWENILAGYAAGDGCLTASKRQRISTVSAVLADQVWMMAATLGLYPMRTVVRADRPGAFANALPGHAIEFGGDVQRKTNRYWNGYYCVRVREAITEHYEGPVHNFRVEGDNSYVAAGVAMHNCMCFIGVRYDPPGLLCLNSWGTKWISGPKWPDDQPDGSFWVKEATATRMLSAGDSFAVSHIKGFPKRALRHDLGW